MKRLKSTAAVLMMSGSGLVPLLAHHGSSGLDKSKAVTIAGVVTQVDWENPHAYLYVDVKDANGGTENWAIECNSSEALRRAGLRGIGVGTTVSMTAYRPASRDAYESKIHPVAARERLQSDHYLAAGCVTTSSIHQRLGYGPRCD